MQKLPTWGETWTRRNGSIFLKKNPHTGRKGFRNYEVGERAGTKKGQGESLVMEHLFTESTKTLHTV